MPGGTGLAARFRYGIQTRTEECITCGNVKGDIVIHNTQRMNIKLLSLNAERCGYIYYKKQLLLLCM